MTETTAETGPHFPEAGDEFATLHGALDRIRATFAWKCGGLGSAGMRARLGPSALSLGGLVKHLTLVEDYYFSWSLLDRPFGPLWARADAADPDWEWHTEIAEDEHPEQLLQLWREAVDRSRANVAEAMADGGLDRLAQQSRWDRRPNLRRLIVDMNEEYARHTGHADLIRESIDGLVGEDPRD